MAREMEAKALAGLPPAKRRELEALIKADVPVHSPKGVAVGAKDSSAAAEKWGKRLTEEQRDAVDDWSQIGFPRMRAVDGGVLGGRPEKFKNITPDDYLKTRKQLVAIRKAMASPSTPRHEGVLYRGLHLPLGVPDAAEYYGQLTTKDHEFHLESLSSWSHNMAVSRDQFSKDQPGGLLVKIRKSTRGVPINAEGLSSFGDEEGEVLLDRGAKYRVVSVTQDPADKHRKIVELVEI